MSLEETYTEVDETIEGKMRRIEDALYQSQQKGYPCEIVRGSTERHEGRYDDDATYKPGAFNALFTKKEKHEPNP